MTMQIGMVGTDGILLAGDTRWTHTPPQYGSGGRHGSNASKIIISEELCMAISCARAMELSCKIANRMIGRFEDKDLVSPTSPIREIAENAMDEVRGNRTDAQCLIAFMRPVLSLYFLHVGGGAIECHQITTKEFAGDDSNPSVFWSERYYKARPLKELIPLAAHMIVSARHFNTAAIDGLEIVLCDSSGIRRLPEESIRKLEASSEKWDMEIGNLFLGGF